MEKLYKTSANITCASIMDDSHVWLSTECCLILSETGSTRKTYKWIEMYHEYQLCRCIMDITFNSQISTSQICRVFVWYSAEIVYNGTLQRSIFVLLEIINLDRTKIRYNYNLVNYQSHRNLTYRRIGFIHAWISLSVC